MQHNDPVHELAERMQSGCLGVRVGRLHRLITRRFDQELRPLGLSVSQLEVLSALTLIGEPVKPAAIAEVLSIERSTMSRNLSLLESRGLVSTTELSASGRSMTVSITDSGLKTLGQAEAAWQRAQAAITGLIGDDAPAMLDGWLGQLTAP